MLRNKTPAQKRTREIYKCDALAQTNQVNYDCFFFLMAQKTKKKIFLKL